MTFEKATAKLAELNRQRDSKLAEIAEKEADLEVLEAEISGVAKLADANKPADSVPAADV